MKNCSKWAIEKARMVMREEIDRRVTKMRNKRAKQLPVPSLVLLIKAALLDPEWHKHVVGLANQDKNYIDIRMDEIIDSSPAAKKLMDRYNASVKPLIEQEDTLKEILDRKMNAIINSAIISGVDGKTLLQQVNEFTKEGV